MKSFIEVSVVGSILICAAGAQVPQPTRQKGVSVHMPVADHAVEMRAADAQQATVVAITSEGKLFVGAEAIEPGVLSSLRAKTVYVKVDDQVQFQKVLTVLDALRGKSVVLLSAPPGNVRTSTIVPAYGTRVMVSR